MKKILITFLLLLCVLASCSVATAQNPFDTPNYFQRVGNKLVLKSGLKFGKSNITDTVTVTNPSGVAGFNVFVRDNDSVANIISSGLKRFSITNTFVGVNNNMAFDISTITTPTSNRTRHWAVYIAQTLNQSANSQELVGVRVRTFWNDNGFSDSRRISFGVENTGGGQWQLASFGAEYTQIYKLLIGYGKTTYVPTSLLEIITQATDTQLFDRIASYRDSSRSDTVFRITYDNKFISEHPFEFHGRNGLNVYFDRDSSYVKFNRLGGLTAGTGVELLAKNILFDANNSYSVGSASLRASNIYSVLGDFSGRLTAALMTLSGIPEYADDAAAGIGGLTIGMVYRTATGELRIKL